MNRKELMKEFRLEKAAHELDIFAKPFPSFKEWELKYKEENEGLFITKSADEAIAESDKIVDEEIQKIINGEMKKSTPKVTKVKAPKSEKKSTTSTVKPTINNNDGKIKKTDLAKSIYQSMMDELKGQHPKRGDVITRFMNECQLSQAGASTYQYNMKKMFSQQTAA